MTGAEAKFKFVYLVSIQKSESIFILAVTAMLLAIGFFIGNGDNHNYAMIYAFAHQYAWGMLFFVYSVVNFMTYWGRTAYITQMLTGIVGLWAWNYIFLSFTVFDTTPMAPTEALLAVPIVVEAWILLSHTNTLEKKKQINKIELVDDEVDA